jgi:transmembrane sensor
MNAPGEFSPQVAEQAVHWLLETQQGALDPRRQQAWQHWLNAHSEHRRAWEHIQQVNQRMGSIAPPLAHAALGAPRSSGRRRALKALLLLGMLGVTGAGLRQRQLLPPLLADFRSPVGQRLQMRLSDGSQLQLNTGSSVDVRFDGARRSIHLLEGEMLLTGAADRRPLSVSTAQGVLVPQAAHFNVRQLHGSTRLAVFGGRVEVSPSALRGYPMWLEAGRQLTFSRTGWGPSAALEANAGAWVDGMLVVSQMRLRDFLAELGRYRRGELACDPSVADLRISGSYPVADTERILDLLEVTLPVKVRRFTRYWVTVEARA